MLIALASGFLLTTITQSMIPEANRDGEPSLAGVLYIAGLSLYALMTLIAGLTTVEHRGRMLFCGAELCMVMASHAQQDDPYGGTSHMGSTHMWRLYTGIDVHDNRRQPRSTRLCRPSGSRARAVGGCWPPAA